MQPWLPRYDEVMLRSFDGASPRARPWTWQQLIDLAPKLVRLDPETGVNTRWACQVSLLPLEIPIWQMGGDVVSSSGSVVVDGPAAVQGVTFWRDLRTVYHLDAPPSPVYKRDRDPNRPYAIGVEGGGFAATTFEPPKWYSAADIAEHWNEGLGFAPIPTGTPGTGRPVTKLELQLAGALSPASRQPAAAFAALRAIEAALGPSLLVSAIRPLAEQRLSKADLDPRLAAAIRWGLEDGRASGADVLVSRLPSPLFQLETAVLSGSQPAAACAKAAQALRDRQRCGPLSAGCPAPA